MRSHWIIAKASEGFDKLTELRWLWLLVARLGVGGEFFLSGWGKLHRLDKLIAYFTELKIPAASIQAPFIATLEFVGGFLLMIGLGTRVAGFLLSSTMVVAMLTAIDFHDKGLADFLYLPEWLLLLLLSSFVFSGAGKASVDAVIARRMNTKAERPR